MTTLGLILDLILGKGRVRDRVHAARHVPGEVEHRAGLQVLPRHAGCVRHVHEGEAGHGEAPLRLPRAGQSARN